MYLFIQTFSRCTLADRHKFHRRARRRTVCNPDVRQAVAGVPAVDCPYTGYWQYDHFCEHSSLLGYCCYYGCFVCLVFRLCVSVLLLCSVCVCVLALQ
jgi:hypothetical protein